jgi:hypothetical protein
VRLGIGGLFLNYSFLFVRIATRPQQRTPLFAAATAASTARYVTVRYGTVRYVRYSKVRYKYGKVRYVTVREVGS